MRTRVKICGLTDPEQVRWAVQAGADAVGLVFYPPSPRCVELAPARAIALAVPALVSVVGLFVNPSRQQVQDVLVQVPLTHLQFHGDESADFCAGFDRPWLKALRMRDGLDVAAAIAPYVQAGAAAILLDTYSDKAAGGTGATFDWSRVPENLALPLILAGGLTPDNVADAIRRVRPYAVDVSGGVERVRGQKDPDLIRQFMQEVSSVEQ